MRVLVTGESRPGGLAGFARASALADGWRSLAPEDDVRAGALGRGLDDARTAWPGRVVVIGAGSRADVELRASLAYLAEEDPRGAVHWAAGWCALREAHGGWGGVREWLRGADRLTTGTIRALLGAESSLATLARTDPAGADDARRTLTAVLTEAQAAGRALPLAGALPPGRGEGAGAGGGVAGLAHALGVPTVDLAAHLLDQLAAQRAWEAIDLHIHVASGLDTWDLPGSVIALAADRAAAHAIPVVAVAPSVGIGARERGAWGIDGTLAAADTLEALYQAGSRLARTWSIPRR